MSTIYALSSGYGRSGVAVIRVSGPASGLIAQAMAGDGLEPRRASLRRLRARGGEILDRGLVLWFPAPASFTGEDCVEFQPHGSRAVISALLKELSRFPDCRPALPGEFARRAFVNGRVDLIELEGLAELLAAETEAQRRMAARHAECGVRMKVESWDAGLGDLLAAAEAELDFSDEDDVVVDLTKERKEASAVANSMRAALADAARSDAMREGFTVAIVGPPNAGKSSLLNALAGHEAAIVSDIPGTTRDAVEIRLDVNGLPIRVIDTAGMRETVDPVERLGVAKAQAAAARADLTLWLARQEAPPEAFRDALKVASQRDRFGSDPLPDWAALGLSIHLKETVSHLLAALHERANAVLQPEAQLVASDRERALIEAAASHCHSAAARSEPELFAEELRSARLALAQVTGKLAASDVLDVVFGRFCIGK